MLSRSGKCASRRIGYVRQGGLVEGRCCGRFSVVGVPLSIVELLAGQFPKRCSLCRAEIPSALVWELLPLVGVQDDGVELLELRSHGCGTTLAVLLAEREEVQP